MRKFIVSTKFESGLGFWFLIKGVKKAKLKLEALSLKFPDNTNLMSETY